MAWLSLKKWSNIRVCYEINEKKGKKKDDYLHTIQYTIQYRGFHKIKRQLTCEKLYNIMIIKHRYGQPKQTNQKLMQKPDISFSMHVDKKKRITPCPIAVSPVRSPK